MSRAQYVWIVVEVPAGPPRAVFTVRYECADWLSRHPEELVEVCRMRDGHHHPDAQPVWLDPDTLEPYPAVGQGE